MIQFSNIEFQKAHGKTPKGTAQWGFQLGKCGQIIWWFGSLTDAKKEVGRKAREEGFSGTIYVLP